MIDKELVESLSVRTVDIVIGEVARASTPLNAFEMGKLSGMIRASLDPQDKMVELETVLFDEVVRLFGKVDESVPDMRGSLRETEALSREYFERLKQ